MKIITEYPYDNYIGYLVTNKDPRRNICLIHKDTRHRTTISYARYLMSVKEKRILLPEEHVDHIDGNRLNDDVKNLQILSATNNNIKSIIQNNRTEILVKMICPNCNNVFIKPLRNTYIKKKGYYTTCSKQCLYKILSKKLSIQELKELGNNQIIEQFRK